MISATRLPASCPQCRAQLLRFYDSARAQLLPGGAFHQRAISRRVSGSAAGIFLKGRRAFSRNISSTRPALQNVGGQEHNATADDIETTVRQARQTFGHTLPRDYLSKEEYKLYERLYGPPLRETLPEDVGIPIHVEAEADAAPKNTLLREGRHGLLEVVEYTIDRPEPPEEEQGAAAASQESGLVSEPPLSNSQIEYLQVKANNSREYHALMKLQRDFEASSLRPVEDEILDEPVEEEEEGENEGEEDDEREPDALFMVREPSGPRLHEFTIAGQFKTTPSTLHLPREDFVDPISTLLKRTKAAHLREVAENVFGGPGLPYSASTPESKSNLPMKPIAIQAGHHKMSDIHSDVYMAAVLPALYASVMSTLVEVRKRLGTDWMRRLIARDGGQGPRVLDVGSGGAGLAAWQEILQAEWEALRERGEVAGREPPTGKRTVVVGSDALRFRMSRFLHNTTFLPRLPDYAHSVENAHRLLDAPATPPPRKRYDVIIASHALMPLDKPYKRRELLDNLWSLLSPEGGVLIVLEKGHPRGFEAVADVRQRLLDEFIVPPTPQPAPPEEIQPEGERVREPGMIIAPCTNHTKCPMYLTPGLSPGRKDFCHFSQRFIRPPFLQRIVGASHRNHEDVKFSFVAVQRGQHPSPLVSADNLADAAAAAAAPPFLQGAEATDRAFAGYGRQLGLDTAAPGAEAGTTTAPHPLSLPRNILPPIKRRGHVALDVCTPAGAIERWTVARSFGKQAYHDARKASWGDLWALGAKTRVPRKVRLGRAPTEANSDGNHNNINGKQAAPKRGRIPVVELSFEPGRGVVESMPKYPGGRAPVQRRTKGGRQVRIDDLMDEIQDVDKELEEELREVDEELAGRS